MYFGYGVNSSEGTNCCTCSGRQCTPIPNVRNSVVFMVLAESATDPATTAPTPVRECACLVRSEAGTLIIHMLPFLMLVQAPLSQAPSARPTTETPTQRPTAVSEKLD